MSPRIANQLASSPQSQAVELRRTLHRVLAVFAILGGCALAGDFMIGGPMSWFVWEWFVAKPVEKKWGFHLDRREHECVGWRDTIVEVTPGGAFDRAGIKPGYFVPPQEGFFPKPGFHYYLDRETETGYVYLQKEPCDSRTRQRFQVHARPAT